ncbi:MAG TPA: hypothetical protein VKP65_13095, partial [Rhodothermales bacterium]|nr:hypothetical protein [Rhodothermales bacterium]
NARNDDNKDIPMRTGTDRTAGNERTLKDSGSRAAYPIKFGDFADPLGCFNHGGGKEGFSLRP